VVAFDEDGRRVAAAAGRLGQPPGPADRHGGPDAVLAGRVVGGGHHAPAVPVLGIGADDQGLATQLRVVALLDGGVVGVHVDVRDDPHGRRF
jgi:hypothetical protein